MTGIFLGIDFGEKRVGLATSSGVGTTAFPYKTLKNEEGLVKEIADIVEKKDIVGIVIGESKDNVGGDNQLMKVLLVFKEKLGKATEVPIYLEPEQFSSVEAARFQSEDKEIDARAAAVILSRYLEKQ